MASFIKILRQMDPTAEAVSRENQNAYLKAWLEIAGRPYFEKLGRNPRAEDWSYALEMIPGAKRGARGADYYHSHQEHAAVTFATDRRFGFVMTRHAPSYENLRSLAKICLRRSEDLFVGAKDLEWTACLSHSTGYSGMIFAVAPPPTPDGQD